MVLEGKTSILSNSVGLLCHDSCNIRTLLTRHVVSPEAR
jgi:hypothetical protein